MKPILSFLILIFPFFLYSQSDTLDLDKFLEEMVRAQLERTKAMQEADYKPDILVISKKNELRKLRQSIQVKREKLERELRKIEANKSAPEKYKGGDKSVIPELIKILKGEDAEQRRLLYNHIDRDYDDPETYQVREAVLVEAIFANLNKEEDFSSIVQLAGYSKLPGYVEVFEDLLIKGKAFKVPRLIFWLGTDGRSMKALDFICENMLAGNFELGGWQNNNILFGLEKYIENGNEEAKKKILQLFWDMLDKNQYGLKDFLDGKVLENVDPAQNILSLMLKYEGEKILPIAEQLSEKEEFKGWVQLALMRIDAKKYKQQLLEGLDFQKSPLAYTNIMIHVFDATAEEEILHEIILQFEQNSFEDYELDSFVSKLIARNQKDLIGKLDQLLKNQDLIKAFQQSYAIQVMSFEELAADALHMGVISQTFSQDVFDRAKAFQEQTSQGKINTLFEAAKISLWFDVEAGIVPLDYDSLMLEFAKNSQGSLEDLEVWLEVEEVSEYEYSYKLTAFENEKAYIIELEDSGDWYELSPIMELLHFILMEKGYKERFVDIFTGDQTAQFIFGPPEAVYAFAKKYKLLHF